MNNELGSVAGCVLKFGYRLVGAEVHSEELKGKALRVRRGCLRESFDVLLLPHHYSRTVLARRSDGTLTIRETQDGIYWGANMDASEAAVDAYTRMHDGYVGCSLGISRIHCEETGETFRGMPILDLVEIELGHIALTDRPALPSAWSRAFDKRFEGKDWFDQILPTILTYKRYFEPQRISEDLTRIEPITEPAQVLALD